MAGNPILYIDPTGLFPYTIHGRSFAPFKEFGGGFHGDSRGWSTQLGKSEKSDGSGVTSRMQLRFIVDPARGALTGAYAWSDPNSHWLFGTETGRTRATISDLKTESQGKSTRTSTFKTVMAANLPLTPSADIDITTYFSITENLEAGILDISVRQTGDKFPSAETLIGDKSGQRLFIGVSPAVGGPYSSLPGDAQRFMMKAEFSVHIDGSGNFTKVQQGSSSYTVDEWNARMRAKPTSKD